MQQYLEIFWTGFRLDGVVIGYTSVLLVLFLLFSPSRWNSIRKRVAITYTSIFYLSFISAEMSGIYFFRYFDFRPNCLVLDHWKDFQLVETAFEAYPIPLVAGITAFLFAGVFLQQKHLSPLCYLPITKDNLELPISG